MYKPYSPVISWRTLYIRGFYYTVWVRADGTRSFVVDELPPN